MRYLFMALTGFMLIGPTIALADIEITESEYKAGVLVIRGSADLKNHLITLDGRYTEWTDADGQFAFRIRYLPRDCVADLKAADNVRSVTVANCEVALPMPSTLDGARRAGSERSKVTDLSVEAASEDHAGAAQLRVVRKICKQGLECRVTCQRDEYAINAFCPDGITTMRSERTVSCSSAGNTPITAYCVSLEK